MQIKITLRSVIIGIVLGFSIVGTIYGYMYWRQAQLEQQNSEFDMEDAKGGDGVWSEKNGVISVSPVSKN